MPRRLREPKEDAMKDTLKISTPNDREVSVTRLFEAPATALFDAMTKPEILERWYGQEGWSLIVCDIDLNVGGKWRFVSRLPNGKEIGQLGVYREIVPGKRLVNTENWEDWDAGECLVTTEFEAQGDGTTLLRSTTRFASEEVRDFILKSGFEGSVEIFYDRLEGQLAASRTQGVSK
jgi:uncharacterized protein YndB with AHSA1/START domain